MTTTLPPPIDPPRRRRVACALALWLAGALLTAAPLAANAAPAHASASITPVRVPDTLAQRALACTGCHGANGRSTPLGYVPRIAGKPAGYLRRQLIAFRDGRRHHEGMARLLAPLDDAFLAELAGHFARLDEPYAPAPIRQADPRRSAQGRQLVEHGDGARRLPACAQCHGAALTGHAPAMPGLLGLPRDYLVAQLGAWRTGQRRASVPDCMAEVARRLQPDDIAVVADWLATQPLPADPKPSTTPPAALPAALAMDCGSLQP